VVSIGVLGFLWIIPWLIVNKKQPQDHPWITDEEKAHILSDQVEKTEVDKEEDKMSLSEILSHKESWGVLVARFFIEPIWWLFVFWMPIYLNKQYGFNVKEIGLYAWFPYVGAAIGSIAGGWAAKKLMEKLSLSTARKRVIAIGCAIIFIAIVGAIFIADTPEKFVAFVFVVLFGFQFAISNIQTISSDLLEGASVGKLAGLAGTVGAVSVVIMNYLIPIITVKSYTPAFIILAVIAPLVVVSLNILCKNIQPLKNK